jgi:hypothetical protein
MAANLSAGVYKDDSCLFMRLPEEIVEEILCYLWLRSDQNLGRLVCTLWNRLLLRIRNKRYETFLQISVKNGKNYWRKYANTSRVSPATRFSHASCVFKGKLVYLVDVHRQILSTTIYLCFVWQRRNGQKLPQADLLQYQENVLH